MSFILDALQRNASDAETGTVPTLHTQAPLATKKIQSDRAGPLMFLSSLALLVGAVSILQPWQRDMVETATPQVAQPEAVSRDVRILGDVDYSRYPLRQRVEPAAEIVAVAPVTVPVSKPVSVVNQQPQGRRVELAEPVASVDDVSPELKQLFDQVVQASKPQAETHSEVVQVEPIAEPDPLVEIEPLTRKPLNYQDRIPSLSFQAHLYSSDVNKRWIKVNGTERAEGDYITDQIRLVAIEPAQVVMEMDGELFSLPALTDW